MSENDAIEVARELAGGEGGHLAAGILRVREAKNVPNWPETTPYSTVSSGTRRA